jgi:Arc/MetJ-type ribon-helix-helix transcriptional regulator
MKLLQLEVPDQLAAELEDLIKEGWFQSPGDVMRFALLDFVRRHRFELTERFQREDIAWALAQKGTD